MVGEQQMVKQTTYVKAHRLGPISAKNAHMERVTFPIVMYNSLDCLYAPGHVLVIDLTVIQAH